MVPCSLQSAATLVDSISIFVDSISCTTAARPTGGEVGPAATPSAGLRLLPSSSAAAARRIRPPRRLTAWRAKVEELLIEAQMLVRSLLIARCRSWRWSRSPNCTSSCPAVQLQIKLPVSFAFFLVMAEA